MPPIRPPFLHSPAAPADLTLRSLRVFVALEEAGSIAGAATRLGASDSGISQHIMALEKAVGAPLFDRRAKPISPTIAGQVLSRHAHKILASVSEAQSDLADISLAALPSLNLAIMDDLDTSLTPVLVSARQSRYRHCFVHAFPRRSDQIVDLLQTRQADIGVSALLPDDSHTVAAHPILSEPFVLVAARGAIPQGQDPRALLQRLPFVQYCEAMPIGRKVAAHLKRVMLNVARKFAFDATRSVLNMVEHTGGWTLTTLLNVATLDGEHEEKKVISEL
jgi:DNA-binding transcriptional LysR family regulator